MRLDLVARVILPGLREGSGSAFMVTPEFGLTARHVLVSGREEELVDSVILDYGHGLAVEAEVVDTDALIDVALLRVSPSQPHELPTLPLADESLLIPEGQAVTLLGWPSSRPFREDMERVVASIDTATTIFNGSPAWKIAAVEAAAGKTLGGFSGGPVTFRSETWSGLSAQHCAVGVVRWNQPKEDATAAGGVLYATPSADILRRWPELGANAVRAPQLPSSSAIRMFLMDRLGGEGRTVAFGGRAAEIQDLRRWLSDREGTPAMLVTGPSGRGKSTLLARVLEQVTSEPVDAEDAWATVFVPINIRYDLASRARVLRNLVHGLAVVHGEDPAAAAAGSPDELQDRMVSYLATPLAKGRSLLLILDGLDEMLDWDATPSMLPLREFGPRTRLLVSARETESRPNPTAWRDALGWEDELSASLRLGLLDEAGVLEVLGNAHPKLEREVILRAQPVLSEVAAGDPLTISLYVQDLRAAKDPTEWLERIERSDAPRGLDGYLKRWWDDQEKLWHGTLGSMTSSAPTVFSLLSCAREPLSRLELMRLGRRTGMETGDELNTALHRLERWITVTEHDARYSISHPRLAESRRRQLSQDEELFRIEATYLAWGKEAVSTVLDSSESARPEPYILRQYAAHLEGVGTGLEDALPLLSRSWRIAYEEVSDSSLSGYARDVERLRRLVDGVNHLALARGGQAHGVEASLACRAASFVALQRAGATPPEVVGQLVRHGLWSDEKALAYIDDAPTTWDRVAAWAAIGPRLGAASLPQVQARVAALISADDEHDSVSARVGYLHFLAAAVGLEIALTTLESFDPDAGTRFRLLLPVLHAVSPPEAWRATVIEVLEFIRQDGRRSQELIRLVARLVPGNLAAEAAGLPNVDALFGWLLSDDAETASSTSFNEPPPDGLQFYANASSWLLDAPLTQQFLWSLTVVTHRVRELQAEVQSTRSAKEMAIDKQDFERAKDLRVEEKSLLSELGPLALRLRHLRFDVYAPILVTSETWPDTSEDFEIARHHFSSYGAEVRRRMLHRAAIEGSMGLLAEFLAQHDLEDDEVADDTNRLLAPELLREALDCLNESPGLSGVAVARRRLLGALANCGESEAREAQRRSGSVESAPGQGIQRARGPEWRLAQELSTPGPTSSGTLVDLVAAFPDQVTGVEAGLALLPQMEGGREPPVQGLLDVLARLPGRPHPATYDLILRVCRLGGGGASVGSLAPLLAGGGIQGDQLHCLLSGLVPKDGSFEHDPVSLTDAIRKLPDLGFDAQWPALETIDQPDDLAVRPWLVRAALERAPAERRQHLLRLLLPTGFLDGASLHRRTSHWVQNVLPLVAVLDTPDLQRVRRSAYRPDVGPRERAHLLTCLAIRFGELGHESALAVARDIQDRGLALAALGGLAESLPESALADWLGAVEGRAGGNELWRQRLLLWCRLAPRVRGVRASLKQELLQLWMREVSMDDVATGPVGIADVAPLLRLLAANPETDRLPALIASILD